MKTIFLSLSLLLSTLNLFAQQIRNPDFENWQDAPNFPGIQVPSEGWSSIFSCKETPCIGNLIKAEGRTGLGAKIFARQSLAGASASAPPLFYVSGFSNKPTKLTFWYKSTKKLIGVVILTKGDPLADNPQIAGIGQDTVDLATEFTKIEIPIIYSNWKTYDSIGLGFRFDNQLLTSDDYFIIDDVQVGYDLTSISDKNIGDLLGSNQIITTLNLNESVEEVHVFDISGNKMVTQLNTQSLDFSAFPEGMYFVSIRTKDAAGTVKVIKF